jgi:hypothetical protein
MGVDQQVAAQRVDVAPNDVRRSCLELALGLDVRHGHALTARHVRAGREVRPERPIDVPRMRPLTFDSVRVVGIHAPHELAHRHQCHGMQRAAKLVRELEHPTRFVDELPQCDLRHKGFELVGARVAHGVWRIYWRMFMSSKYTFYSRLLHVFSKCGGSFGGRIGGRWAC